MFSSIPRDVQEFLDGYPANDDDKSLSENLEFYSNELRSKPDNVFIGEIHERWRGDYSKLERKHGYIQWLFPIQEHGMNYESQPLQRHEIIAMKASAEIMSRILRSYRLMLDFYGMELCSSDTGLLKRVEPDTKNYDRYRNLVRSGHNYLRISRILKCLSEMGLEYLNTGFLLHVLNEQSEHGALDTPAIRSSMDRWWANCIRNDTEREWIRGMIRKVRSGSEFVFTREMYEGALVSERRRRREVPTSMNDGCLGM